MESSTAPSANKGWLYLELVLFLLLALFGADWLGDTFSSILLNLAVGALFYPVMGLLLPTSLSDPILQQGYLGLKYPSLPFWISLVFFALCIGLLLLARQDASKGYALAVLGGVFLWAGIEQLKLWRRVRNVSAGNE